MIPQNVNFHRNVIHSDTEQSLSIFSGVPRPPSVFPRVPLVYPRLSFFSIFLFLFLFCLPLPHNVGVMEHYYFDYYVQYRRKILISCSIEIITLHLGFKLSAVRLLKLSFTLIMFRGNIQLLSDTCVIQVRECLTDQNSILLAVLPAWTNWRIHTRRQSASPAASTEAQSRACGRNVVA